MIIHKTKFSSARSFESKELQPRIRARTVRQLCDDGIPVGCLSDFKLHTSCKKEARPSCRVDRR